MSTYYNLIKRTYEQKNLRKWEVLFWCIDLHDVIIEGKYSKFNEGREFAPGANRVLKFLSGRYDTRLILWTSSHKGPIKDIRDWMAESSVLFDYVNENPMCESTDLCSFDKKFYFNLLLDDKAGFDWRTDWLEIERALKEIYGDDYR